MKTLKKGIHDLFTRYQLYYTRWIVTKDRIIPAIYDRTTKQIIVLEDDKEILLPDDEFVVEKHYGEGTELLMYEDVCHDYDYKYCPLFDGACTERERIQAMKNGGAQLPMFEGFEPRYKYHRDATKRKLHKIANYLQYCRTHERTSEDIIDEMSRSL